MNKGQVTLFVVLGLVIVIILGLALFLIPKNNQVTKLEIQEADEIYSLTKQCLTDLSKEAIILSGKNSGYVTTEDLGLEQNPLFATKSDYLAYSPGMLPYWYYVDDQRNVASSFKPPLCRTYPCEINSIGPGSIQEKIETYVQEKILECANIQDYEGRVDIQRGEPLVSLDIGAKSVIVNLFWPHNITLNDQTEEFNEIVTSHDVKLANIYKVSELISAEERYYQRFSSQTMSMISLYSGMEEPLPPITATDFSLFGGNNMWISENVKVHIKDQIIPLMELYQVKQSKYYEPYTFENDDYSVFKEGIYSSFEIGLGDSEVRNIELLDGLATEFRLPLVQPQITINEGAQIIKGEDLSGSADLIMKLMGLGVTRYRTTYSVSYPLIFRVVDEEAFGGEGFEFLTAFEVNVWNNQPTKTPFNEQLAELDEAFEGISLYRYDNREFTVNVLNKKDGSGINDAVVTYVCVEEHYLGRTDVSGKAVGKIPYCEIGGFFEVFHPSYNDVVIPYDHSGLEHELDVRIWMIENKEVTVHKRNTFDMDFSGPEIPTPQPINPENDYVIIVFEPLNHTWPPTQVVSLGDTEFMDDSLRTLSDNSNLEQFDNFEIPENYEINSSENNIMLVPGKYLVTAILLDTIPFHLDDEEDCAVLGLAGCSNYPAQDFDTWPTGGLILEREFFEEEIYEENQLDIILQEIVRPLFWEDIRAENRFWDESKQNLNVVDIRFE